MAGLNPIIAAKTMKEKYIRYLLTTFKIDDEEIEKQFREKLNERNKISKGPYLEVSNSFEKGKTINELIEDSILTKEFNNFKSEAFPFEDKNKNIYLHQEQAIEKAAKGENIVVSTGTGSGKTESFVIPILNELLKEKEEGTLNSGVRALILYPMNALVNDQIKRFRKLLKDYPEITFGKFTGETEEQEKKARRNYEEQIEESIPNEIVSREEMRKNPPHILITNYAMLEYLMLRPEDNSFFQGPTSKQWKFIVLDEAHTYKGALGIEISMLLRRLKETIKKKDEIQFILTSASLGGGKKDYPDIVKFAENLTGEKFKEENIIGATRIKYEILGQEDFNLKLYEELSDNIENKDQIIEIIKKYGYIKYFNEEELINYKIEEILYELILKDNTFYKARKLLDEPQDIYELAEALNISEIESLIAFIFVASKAEKDGIQLFKSKYHYFFKALEGGFLSIAPYKKFFLNRRESAIVDGEDIKVFEISTCRFCNEIYLVGELKTKGEYKVLTQKTDNFEELPRDLDYFLLKSSILETNEDDDSLDEKTGTEKNIICGKCGTVFNKSSLTGRCDCGEKYYCEVLKITKNKKNILHTCKACGSTNTQGPVLKRFIMGAEGATAALGTALYEALPDTEITVKSSSNEVKLNRFGKNKQTIIEEKKELIRQFLVFSDSRQAAAYYATFMDESYNKFIRKRVVYEVVSQADRDLSIAELVKRVTGIFEKENIFDTSDKNFSNENEAWKSVLYELFNVDRRYGLEGLGLIDFYIDFDDLGEINELSEVEVITLFQECCNLFKNKGAIKYDFSMPDADKEYFSYTKKEPLINLSNPDSKKNISSWQTSRNNNSRVFYLKKILNCNLEEANQFLKEMWEYIAESGKLLVKNTKSDGYQLKLEKIKVRNGQKINWYYCDTCRKLTPNNIRDFCPTYGCNGELMEVNPEDIFAENHYRNLSKDLIIKAFKIKEHTAQLDSKLAYETQEKFTKQKLNALSCSTTFEVGVDVGELETVFMRNMPPSPANYAQRSGRAGRRGGSSAFTVTFCSQKSHDFTFFKNPMKMIKGMIPPPKFNIDNEKIIIRHIYAVCFSFFWKKNSEFYGEGKVINIFDDKIIEEFRKYINSKPEEIKVFLKDILSDNIQKGLEIETWGWTKALLENNSEGALYRVKTEFLSERDELENIRKELINKMAKDDKTTGRDASNLIKIEGMKNNIESKTVINYFAQKNLLPRYGFPVDSVELYSDTKNELRLSRDLGMAISEYAPGAQVIANGRLLTSRYLKVVPNLNWKIYKFGVCNECKTLNQKIYGDSVEEIECSNCGTEVPLLNEYVIPEFGFKADSNSEKAGTKKPKKLYSSDVYPIENKNAVKIAEKEITIKNGKVQLKSFKDEELGIISQKKFYICESCGYGEPNLTNLKFTKKNHNNPSGYSCNHGLKSYNLGHKFKTDIVTISFESNSYLKINLSVLYGLLEGISNYLDIDRSDISGCIKKINNRNHIVVYDTVPGGAGHVKRILEEDNIKNILEKTEEIVSQCECGEETSCYSCLRDFSNQRYHEELKRGDVIEFIKDFKGEIYI